MGIDPSYTEVIVGFTQRIFCSSICLEGIEKHLNSYKQWIYGPALVGRKRSETANKH
jgi:hypothetical protein